MLANLNNLLNIKKIKINLFFVINSFLYMEVIYFRPILNTKIYLYFLNLIKLSLKVFIKYFLLCKYHFCLIIL